MHAINDPNHPPHGGAVLGKLQIVDLTDDPEYMVHFFQDRLLAEYKFIFLENVDTVSKDLDARTQVFLENLAAMDKYKDDVVFHFGHVSESHNGRLLTSFGLQPNSLPAVVMYNSKKMRTYQFVNAEDNFRKAIEQVDFGLFTRFIDGCMRGTWPIVGRDHKKSARKARSEL
jgi:hypothetical protein